MNEETRVIGYCEECGLIITDKLDECYCDSDGYYFDSLECALAYHNIHKLEI